MKCIDVVYGISEKKSKLHIVGKKVEVSLQLFDIFQRNMVFIFLLGSFGTHPADWGLR